ncbi:hypothetical protein KY336_02000 [Candidatus Woesearchaeota archaeon]|nr:hypothetical protein [Candidatus Woesearchaeota archaeon]
MSKIARFTGHIVSLKSNGKEVWGTVSQDKGGKIELKPISIKNFKLNIYDKVTYEREIKKGLFGLTGTKTWAVKLKKLDKKK